MQTDNPLLLRNPLPRFGEIRAAQVLPAITGLLERNRGQLERLLAAPVATFKSLVEPLEDSQHELGSVWSQVSHLNAVLNSPDLREAYNACLPLLSAWQTDLAQNEALCRACQRIAATDQTLDATQRRVVEHRLREFRLAGVALDPKAKVRFKELMQQLTQLTAKFEENVLDATNAWSHHVTDATQLAGVNPSIIERARLAAGDKGGYLLRLEQPVYVAVMSDAASPALRRTFYEAWTTRASDQAPGATRWDNSVVMEDIMRVRHELARLLDFSSCRLRPRDAHGENVGRGLCIPRAAAGGEPSGGRTGTARTRGLRRCQTCGLGSVLLVRAAAARTVLDLTGGTAPVVRTAARPYRAV